MCTKPVVSLIIEFRFPLPLNLNLLEHGMHFGRASTFHKTPQAPAACDPSHEHSVYQLETFIPLQYQTARKIWDWHFM
jgi:hypothetical protein